jgi:hypothetical protein
MRISRRGFVAGMGAASLGGRLEAHALRAMLHCPIELSFTSAKFYANPFQDVDVDVIVRDPDGVELRIPAFWAGAQTWRVRYSPAKLGTHTWRSVSADTANAGLHGQQNSFLAGAYDGTNPLYRHGPLRVASDHRHFEHGDGTPFFWLADTWWMGLVKRLRWPEDFQLLVSDRARKGFTVVQIVAGLYPDMPERDPRGANEAGFPYDAGYAQINPAYFDRADVRIQHLVNSGLAPCIVGCWGYYLPILGVEKMKRHWRYLVARWGAYPAVWCLAGEGTMPYYLSKEPDRDRALQRTGWTELAKYVRSISAHGNPITIHPSSSARSTVEDPAVLDFDMLQTGHSDRESIPNTVKAVTRSYAAVPAMPVVNGEVCYEGIQEASRQEVQRFMFWACLLSGASGHTYGANGIWQVNTPDEPFGASPHGRSWGDTPWQTAYQLPGSTQLGMAKKLLGKYPWWRMQPHPEWIEPHWSGQNYMQPYGAGIAGELRVFYFPRTGNVNHKIVKLENGLRYRAFWWNPVTGRETDLGTITGADEWHPAAPPIFQDYVLMMVAIQ